MARRAASSQRGPSRRWLPAALAVNLLALPSAGVAETAPGVEGDAIVRVILALIVVLAAIVALAWVMRRFGGGGVTASGNMRVLGSIAVGQRERVVLVQVGDTQLLLGVAPGRVQTLHILETPVASTGGGPGGAQGSPFAARLRRMMQQPEQQ